MIEKESFKVERKEYRNYYFSQLIDILYYPALSVLGRGPESGVSHYVSENDNILGRLFKLANTVVKSAENVESVILSKIPIGINLFISASLEDKSTRD
jgi:hypothetical protein